MAAAQGELIACMPDRSALGVVARALARCVSLQTLFLVRLLVHPIQAGGLLFLAWFLPLFLKMTRKCNARWCVISERGEELQTAQRFAA